MKKLTKVIILDSVLILMYILYLYISNSMYYYYTRYWYEVLLVLIGIGSISHATLVRSKILVIVGIVIIIYSIVRIM